MKLLCEAVRSRRGASRYRPSPRHHSATSTSICELSDTGFEQTDAVSASGSRGGHARDDGQTQPPTRSRWRDRDHRNAVFRSFQRFAGRDEDCARPPSDGRPRPRFSELMDEHAVSPSDGGRRSWWTALTELELALQQYERIGSHVGVEQCAAAARSFAAVKH